MQWNKNNPRGMLTPSQPELGPEDAQFSLSGCRPKAERRLCPTGTPRGAPLGVDELHFGLLRSRGCVQRLQPLLKAPGGAASSAARPRRPWGAPRQRSAGGSQRAVGAAPGL